MARKDYIVAAPLQHQLNAPPGPRKYLAPYCSTYASIDGDDVQTHQPANADSELLMMPKTYADRNDVDGYAWGFRDEVIAIQAFNLHAYLHAYIAEPFHGCNVVVPRVTGTHMLACVSDVYIPSRSARSSLSRKIGT